MCPHEVHPPPRDEGQRRRDALRTGEQIDQLKQDDDNPSTQASGGSQRVPLDHRLRDRHTGPDAPKGAVPFEIVQKVGGGSALVTSRQVVVRRRADRDSDVAALLARLDFKGEPTTDAAPLLRLRALVSLYTYTGPEGQRVSRIDEAVDNLKDVGAARAMMTALHKTIVKSTDGPAPTSVTDDTQFLAAGTHQPAGDIVVAVIDTGIAEESRQDGWLNEVEREGCIDQLDVFPTHNRLDSPRGTAPSPPASCARSIPTPESGSTALWTPKGWPARSTSPTR